MGFRIGFGYDVHRLEPDIPFWIGGVSIPHEKGALGHSDADVLIHAICDALLGAAALGDIGTHFPDTDPAYRGIASTLLLKQTGNLLRKNGYRVGNIDSTVCLQLPKIKPFIPQMREEIACCLGIEAGAVSVKATTEEKLGFTGREEGISAYAVALIQ
ncbi:MAG: 2-C-methyl-D-erythritol 2,4-cyclodiphosphate synthase [Bacteroidetes bacterium]|nr:2-C-methyl-D-erythritol 2,4-cyclodiphosphate synthase [Bacteroidota bacterium]